MMTLCESMLLKRIITGERRFFTLFLEEIGFFYGLWNQKRRILGLTICLMRLVLRAIETYLATGTHTND